MPVSLLRQKAKSLLKGTLKHAGTAALAAALVPLGSVEVSAQINSSDVQSTVTGTAPNVLYEFEVFNTSPPFDPEEEIFSDIIVDWELPLFDENDVSNVGSPDGWSWVIIPPDQLPDTFPFTGEWNYDASEDPLLDPDQGGDPDLYGPNPQVFEDPPLVLHWFFDGEGENGPIFPGDSLEGFSFESAWSDQNAPYLTSWDELPPVGGDPPIPDSGFVSPLSPARQAAQAIPEPSTAALLGLGSILVFAGATWRRRRDTDSLTITVDTDNVDD